MKIAIIGTGISGLSAAWMLHDKHDITVYEAQSRPGGHANTVESEGHGPVDTGFIVYNTRSYPNLIALFNYLGVETLETDMSFAVSMDNRGYEYAGHALFAQKRNLFNPVHYKMIRDIARFFKTAPEVLEWKDSPTLQEFLDRKRFSAAFQKYHIHPMATAIWSGTVNDIREFPAKSFIRFFINHGLLEFSNRPPWRTVLGGSRCYVEKIISPFQDSIHYKSPVHQIRRVNNGVIVNNAEHYDQVIIATHSDQALAMVQDLSDMEAQILKSFPYAHNKAYLHWDEKWMPRARKAWSSWNYLGDMNNRVCVTYWMNRLQPFLPPENNLFVTLNPPEKPDNIIREFDYAHPQFKKDAYSAWREIHKIQGKNGLWYCGAWCGYGFHEDGLSAGLKVAERLGECKRPWDVTELSPAGANICGYQD